MSEIIGCAYVNVGYDNKSSALHNCAVAFDKHQGRVLGFESD